MPETLPPAQLNGHPRLPSAIELALTRLERPQRASEFRGALPAPKPGRVGFTGGVSRLGRLTSEEYLTELSPSQRILVYQKMRSDGLIEALLTALKLPVIAASWHVEPASRDANALKAADLVERNLFQVLGCCWESVLREVLSYQQFGFSLLAKNWRLEKGELLLDDLLPLHPRTIVQGKADWTYDERGRLTGAWQSGYDGQRWRDEFIPVESLLHFANDREFREPWGRSVLRASYKHWLIKDTLYRVQAIGLERGAIGTPVARYPASYSVEQQDDLFTFITNYGAYETAGAIFPVGAVGEEGPLFENISVDIKTADLMAAIHHHDAEASKSVLAMWLNLGQEGAGGAYALSADQTDLFLLSLESVADYVAARLNRDVIPQLVGYNLATDQYPTLSATVARTSASALAGLIRPLTAGANAPITFGEGDEDWLRERLQLPARIEPRPERVGPAAAAAARAGQLPPEEKLPGGEKPPPEPAGMSRRELIVLQDPPRFRGETPAYPELGRVAAEFHAALVVASRRLRERVWQVTGLPDVAEEAPAAFNVGSRKLELTKPQLKALDTAIERFLAEFAGEERTERGFVGTDAEDALLQGFLRLGHSVGANEVVRLTHARAAAFQPTRESPEIRALLTSAFQRLSQDGQLRIGGKLGELREKLVEASLAGRNPLAVARDLHERFAGYERHEWERLTRTEMAFAANQGQVDEARAEGIERLEVLVSGLACPICAASSGVVILASAAVVGENVPPFHPHCLCSVAPVPNEPRGLLARWLRFSGADQPRDERGRWESTGGGEAGDVKSDKYGKVSMRPGTAADRDNSLIHDKIPPGITNLRVAEKLAEGAPVQWVGTQANGKAKYGYSAEHHASADTSKFERAAALHANIEPIRTAWAAEIATGGSREHEARVLSLVEKTGFRNGGEEARTAIKNEEKEIIGHIATYGASSLKTSHARVDGDKVHFDFIGKAGVRQRHTVEDAGLARFTEARQAAREEKLFDTNSAKSLNYMKQSSGGNYIVHDLRTRRATIQAAEAVNHINARGEAPRTAAELPRAINRVAKIAGRRIGDKPKVALDKYVDPRVFQGWRTSAE